jgi:hypothetical protein
MKTVDVSKQRCEAQDYADPDACAAKYCDRMLEHSPEVGGNSCNDQYETRKRKDGAHTVAPIQQAHQGISIFLLVRSRVAIRGGGA